MQACVLNVAGCGIVITVDNPSTTGRQADVVAAVASSSEEIARIIVQRLRVQSPVDEWDVVDDPLPRPAAKSAPPPPPGPEPAVGDYVPPPPAARRIVAGQAVPPPPPGVAPETTEVPPPAPPRGATKAAPLQRPWTFLEPGPSGGVGGTILARQRLKFDGICF